VEPFGGEIRDSCDLGPRRDRRQGHGRASAIAMLALARERRALAAT
jgi:hypothetical protein